MGPRLPGDTPGDGLAGWEGDAAAPPHAASSVVAAVSVISRMDEARI